MNHLRQEVDLTQVSLCGILYLQLENGILYTSPPEGLLPISNPLSRAGIIQIPLVYKGGIEYDRIIEDRLDISLSVGVFFS